MKKPTFEFYTRINGKNEFIEFYNTLTTKEQQKLLAVIKQVEEHGLLVASKMKWTKKLQDNLFELRSGTGGNIQRVIYFHAVESRYIITHGFVKKQQKTPKKEIDHALEIRKEFEEGNN